MTTNLGYEMPEKYRVERLPREKLIEALLSRKGRRWFYEGKYLWVWDVKIHCWVDSWEKIAAELETAVADHIGREWWEDPDFQERARNAVADAFISESRSFHLFYTTLDLMQSSVQRDDDAYKMLWAGRCMDPVWVFKGRSAGWLCLEGLLGTSFRNWESYEYREWLEELEEDDLFDVYQFLHQCDVDFAGDNLEANFKYYFADQLMRWADLQEIPDQLLAERAVLVDGDGI